MKKWIWVILAVLMLAGCGRQAEQGVSQDTTQPGSGTPEQESHIHIAGTERLCNKDYHWFVCACGREMDKQAHNMDPNTCTDCGLRKDISADGSVLLTGHDSHGNCIYSALFDPNGACQDERKMVYSYNEQGVKIYEQVQVNGNLFYKRHYDVQDGVSYLSSEEVCASEGVTLSTYDRWGHLLEQTVTDGDGQVVKQIKNEYELYPHGDVMVRTTFSAGVMTEKCYYYSSTDGEYYQTKMIRYHAEGSYTVYSYDKEGTCLDETSYDKDGNIIAG